MAKEKKSNKEAKKKPAEAGTKKLSSYQSGKGSSSSDLTSIPKKK